MVTPQNLKHMAVKRPSFVRISTECYPWPGHPKDRRYYAGGDEIGTALKHYVDGKNGWIVVDLEHQIWLLMKEKKRGHDMRKYLFAAVPEGCQDHAYTDFHTMYGTDGQRPHFQYLIMFNGQDHQLIHTEDPDYEVKHKPVVEEVSRTLKEMLYDQFSVRGYWDRKNDLHGRGMIARITGYFRSSPGAAIGGIGGNQNV